MEQKPSKELIEQAEIYASVGLTIHHITEYLDESGLLQKGIPERLRAACYILLGLEYRLGTEDVKELIAGEGTQIIALSTDSDGLPAGLIEV